MLTIHSTGNWSRGSVHVHRVPSTRRMDPQVESIIESAWQEGQRLLGSKLFDGPMARMESWIASPDRLDLSLSLTSYRIFYGTNLTSPRLDKPIPREAMANPVGVSTALLTRDDWLLFGRRNNSVAYYPQRVHPFAGALEEKDLGDVFGAVEREFGEELRLTPGEIESVQCLGIVEDSVIRHPELIFRARVHLTRAQLEAQVHDDEHRGSVAIEATQGAVESALRRVGTAHHAGEGGQCPPYEDAEFTPVGIAALLLFGRDAFGDEWFAQAARSLPVSVPSRGF